VPVVRSTFVRQPLTRVASRYDRLARWYRFAGPLILLAPGFRRKAVQRLGLKRGETVLEIGCGTGRNCRASHAPRLTAHGRRAIPRMCGSGGMNGAGLNGNRSHVSITKPACSMPVLVSRARWQPPATWGQNVASAKR
jgi:hypothetical protein